MYAEKQVYCVGGQWNSLQDLICENVLYLCLPAADVWQNCLFKSGSKNATNTLFPSPIYPSMSVIQPIYFRHQGKWRN